MTRRILTACAVGVGLFTVGFVGGLIVGIIHEVEDAVAAIGTDDERLWWPARAKIGDA